MTKKAKPRLLAFDGNYVIMRSNYAFRDLSIGDQPSGAVYGYVKTFQDLLQSYQPEVLLPLFDNGRSNYRLAISEHYKENRGKKDDKLVNQIRACHEFVELTGLKPYIEKNTEADDLAAKTAKDCHEDYFVMLYSKDHDWQQLTGEDVVFMRPKGRGDGIDIVSYDKAKEDIDFPPERWPEIAAIMGDPGDSVYGLKGWGWQRSKKAINKYGDLWNAVAKDPVLSQHSLQILNNYKMTVLDGSVPKTDVPVEADHVNNLRLNKDNDKLMEFLDKWQMKSFIRQIEDGSFWQRPI